MEAGDYVLSEVLKVATLMWDRKDNPNRLVIFKNCAVEEEGAPAFLQKCSTIKH